MSDNLEGIFKLTTPVLSSFPNLDEARAVKGKNGAASGEPKFSDNFEFDADHADLKGLKAKAFAIARAKWPGRDLAYEAGTKDKEGNPKLPEFVFPFTSGDKLADKAVKNGKEREWSRGKAVITSRSKFQPTLSVVVNGKIVDIDGNDKAAIKKYFYTGVLVLAEFNFQAYDGVGQNPDGVTAYLNKVCSLNRGARLTGGTSSAETFKDYIGSASGYDPTEGLDEEIPF